MAALLASASFLAAAAGSIGGVLALVTQKGWPYSSDGPIVLFMRHTGFA